MKYFNINTYEFKHKHEEQIKYIKNREYLNNYEKLKAIRHAEYNYKLMIDVFNSIEEKDIGTKQFNFFISIFINYVGIEKFKELNIGPLKDQLDSVVILLKLVG